MPGALRTDLYELNMTASYLRREMRDVATFSLYVRTMPANRGFLVAGGLDDCLDYLKNLSFEGEDLAFLSELGFPQGDLDAFRDLRFTGDVWAVPEGRVVYPGEPLLEVSGPVAESQLVETALLNAITLHTTVASKAARCVIAAGGRQLVDFSLRRDQGVDASLAVARACAIVGFAATSNVEASRRLGVPAAGTMAHSYIEAFPTERDAFKAFAEDHPTRTTFLVDTYDTLAGVRTAINVIRELSLQPPLSVRIDSGDIAELSRRARKILDDAGLADVRIFASGGLDEFSVHRLLVGGAPIDAFGVGTLVGVSADAPYVDSVYKLVEYAGRPVLKLSQGKATAPGAKQVFRSADGDVIALRNEPAPPGAEPLLQPVMEGGRRLADPEPLEAKRERFERDLASLPADAKRIEDPVAPEVPFSDALQRLTDETRAEMLLRQSSVRSRTT
ncbi:MAG: nicotinate phosphoribosyltransferase [Actinomycetota bacterium]